MALPITVPYTFGNATTAIPLSNLDSDYATVYQAVNGIGNGSVALANVAITGGTISGNTTASNVTVSSGTFTNVTLSNVTISSVSTPITAAEGGTGSSSAFTTNGVVYASSTSALATGSALTFDGTNLGLGVTPSAWDTNARAIQLRSAGGLYDLNFGGASTYMFLSNNSYRSASGIDRYLNTYAASVYYQNNGSHYWETAASGTAGNAITFTQAMTLDASGNLGVGTTSPSSYGKLAVRGFVNSVNVNASTFNNVSFSTSDGTNSSFFIQHGGSTVNLLSDSALCFYTAVSSTVAERGRFDTSGNLLVGYTSSNGSYKLQVNSQIFATSSTIATSDARYKTNVTPISNGLSLVNKLNPVSFDWKEHSVHNFDTKNTNVGFLAQDVQEVLKDEIYLNSVIRKNETELPDGTKEEFLGLSDSSLIPILVKAIQEQQTLIESLTARLTALENK